MGMHSNSHCCAPPPNKQIILLSSNSVLLDFALFTMSNFSNAWWGSLCFQWLSSKSLPSREAGCVTMTISSCSIKVLYLTSHPMRRWQEKHLQETSQTTTGLVKVNSDYFFIHKVTKLWTYLTDMTHWWNLIGVCIFLKCYHFSFVYNNHQHYHYYSKYLWKNGNAVFFLSILPSTLKNTLP